jgi:methionine-gamma-lyase
MNHLRTRAVHSGQKPDVVSGAIATPVTQTSASAYGTLEHGAAIFAGEAEGYRYSCFANPTVKALEDKIADLKGAEAAGAFSSGTAVVSSSLLSLLAPGDEVVFHAFGGRFGIWVVDTAERGLEVSLSAAALLDNLKLFTEAVFLDDVDSLACHLASTAHSLIRPKRGYGAESARD